MAPLRQKAVIVKDGVALLAEAAVPKPGPGQVLVKVVACGQNPTDWKTAKFVNAQGAIIGVDFAGVVEELGPDVPPDVRHVGERVCGFVHGGIHENGSFSEYLVASARLGIFAVPEGWSFEDAAQLGVPALTAVLCLYEAHSFPAPLAPSKDPEPLPVLVYGGSTAVGTYTVQFLALAGLQVYATASPRNFDYVKSLGAVEVFDYHDPEVGKKIREATGGKLKHAVDTISEGGSPQIISDALSEEGGLVAQILVYPSPRPGVDVNFILAYDLLGESHRRRQTEERQIFEAVVRLLALGKVKPIPKLLLPNGLASVSEGFELMKSNKISAQKITYRIADTPT
ncbi:dehydrogenase [Gloeopeniophorella convolvens]|nr:dehydrogenase [Gloeopeniophorella convolvens]